MRVCIFIIITLYAFFFENVKKYKINEEIFEIQLYFDFYKSSTEDSKNLVWTDYKPLKASPDSTDSR